jgi:hypothetical protein
MCSPFSSRFITSNFTSTPAVFHQFFTCIALGDENVRFSLIFVPKATDEEGGITGAARQRDQSTNPYT